MFNAARYVVTASMIVLQSTCHHCCISAEQTERMRIPHGVQRTLKGLRLSERTEHVGCEA